MISRSASVPALSVLVPESDRPDFSPLSKAFLHCSHAFFRIKQGDRLSSLSLDLRRARSQTDLQAMLYESNPSERRTFREKNGHRSAESFETFIPLIHEATLSSTEEDAQSWSAGCRSACPARISACCSQFSFEVENTCKAGTTSNPDTQAANSEGNMYTGGRGGKRAGHDRGHDGADGSRKDFHQPDSADSRYRKLLQSDPQNPLLLRNYAQFLSEAKHDYKRAEEYYERAILASPNDGEVLSMYAKHVWDVHKDSDRAGNYFDQAMKASPHDCYVLGSYASFLWQSEEEEESGDVYGPIDPPSQIIFGQNCSIIASA